MIGPFLGDRLERIASRFGCNISWNRAPMDGPGLCYVGRSRSISARGLSASSLVHELAHFAVCPKSRRQRDDFGLGAGPETRGDVRMWVGRTGSILEEERVSVLGICIERDLGLPWSETVDEHSWLERAVCPCREPGLTGRWPEGFMPSDDGRRVVCGEPGHLSSLDLPETLALPGMEDMGKAAAWLMVRGLLTPRDLRPTYRVRGCRQADTTGTPPGSEDPRNFRPW